MRLAPIALVLLTSFALVTAIPVDPPDEDGAETGAEATAKRWKKMENLGSEIVKHQFEIQRSQTDPTVNVSHHEMEVKNKHAELSNLANAAAIVRIPELSPPKPGSKGGAGTFFSDQSIKHSNGLRRERKNQGEAERLAGSRYADLALTHALQARHGELGKKRKDELVRAPLFFA
jgi:hypothetical protein